MLYVFSVETGTMLTFEMNLAVDTVDVLMCAIAKTCGIPEDKQVLLVSGGSNLDPESKVCEYGSGTDTCPIFLFNKCAIESDISPRPSIGNASGINMPELVEGCLNMPTTYQTVVVRAQLAQQFAELATNELMVCERLVHDQRLQQQGWATVIANLQDATLNCRKGANEMRHIVHQYLESRPSYRAMLLNIQEVIDLLSTIPLLPSLLLKNDSEADRQHSKQTLLDWLSKSQPKSYIENYAVQCLPLIDNFNEDTWSQLEKDIEEVLIDVENKNMKKVKGLEERLYSLDKLMSEAKKYERDQTEQAQNLLNNKVRVSNLQDMSVLPDLCMTHRHQLELMLKNHQNLTEIRERCTRAKIELCSNLHTRLKWILNVENKMFDVNNKLGIYKEYLEILKHHFGTIKEVQSAPTNYLKAVVEVCRRRNFSSNFLKWSWSLSEQSHNLYKNEVTLRKKFNSEFSNSFMKTLFPGMEDFPPPFATERPEPFDLHLPKIIPEDLDRLRQCLPDLVSILEVPQTIEMPHFCVTPDSAFSSEIPSSRAGLASTSGSLGTQLLKTEVKECVSVGDYDYALNECISLTSSPFEDAPLSDDASSKQEKSPLKKKHEEPEVDCKRFHLADCVSDKEAFSPIEEEQHDSDAEEFEQVDDIPKSDQYDTLCQITILTETHDIDKDSDLNKTDIGKSCKTSDIVIPKTSSICRVTSPLEERLRSPEAMLTSQDFQPTDYFIDDSMPSSYTESNGTSALSRGNQMVKSHHLIVAELQNQIEEKNVALENAQGNLKMNRTNILKLRRTITALQKYMQDILDGLRTDLIALKEYVMNEKSLALHQICDMMEEVKTVVAGMQSRIHSEQESTVNDAVRREREMMESVLQKYKYQLETEQQKLFDCHTEIDVYQKQIRQHQIVLEELKQESDHELQELKKDLSDENDQLVKGMILEHELELENLRDILKKTTQEKEGEIREIREALCDKEAQLHLLLTEKENFQVEQMPHLQKEKDLQTYSVEMDNKDKQDATIKQALEQQDSCHKEDLARIKIDYEKHMCEMQEQMKHDLGIEYNEKIQKLKSEMVNEYEQTLAEQRLLHKKEMEDELLQSNQALIAHYEQQLESMQLHFKQTYSSSLNKKSCSCHMEEFRDAVPHQLRTLEEMRDFDKDKNLLVSLQDDYLPTERERDENELLELKTTVQRYKEEFEKLKMQHRAKEQVIFNEAISKATREKDILIEELRKQISVLEIQQSSLMSVFDQVTKVIIMVKEEFSSSSCDARFVKNRTAILKKISETQKSVEEIRNGICSSTCVPPIVDDQLTKPDVRKEERICELEMMLQRKEEELGNLKTKFIKLSMYESVRSSLLSDKVSVMSCNVGEIVILYYDEKHENYMVLQFAAAPHFLHSDSFEVLNIKIPPEDPKKHWTLAQVINKEHCQAKKIFNRYKVPYGSRFYRVKVVPWDREAAFQRHSQRRHGQMGASSSSEESGAAAPVFPVSADKASGSQMSASAI